LEGTLTEARNAASQLYRQVQQNVQAFNALTPGEDVTIDFADPRPRRGRRTGGGHGSAHDAPPAHETATDTPRFHLPDAEEGDEGAASAPVHPEPHTEPHGRAPDSVDLEAGE